MAERAMRLDGYEQDVWAAADAIASAEGLESVDRARLRIWTADQMRELPGRVWKRHGERGSIEMRRSFEGAIGRAARIIRTGASPR